VTPGRDGLDDWLGREVRPLPPPAGTFELINKRARRRKLRKLAVTLTSAAAVAAAAVFAVPTVMALHLSPSHQNGVAVGNGSTSPTPNALSTPPTATPAPGRTKSPSPTTPASTLTPGSASGVTAAGGGPVPPNFQPTSVTFVSAYEGWTIGQAGTPGTCANADPTVCTSMARTNDRGRTWTGVPAPSTKLVSGIRFLDGVNGWAFGPQLWSTHDRGSTWTQVDTHGQEVIDLETAGTQAYAVFATCSNDPPNGNVGDPAQPHSCTSFTLKSAAAAADAWSPVGSATTGLTVGASNWVGAYLVLGSGRGWLLGPDDSLYSGSLASGSWQKVGSAPCQLTKLLTWVKPTGSLVAACNRQAASGGPTGVTVYTSTDDGATWANGGSTTSSGAVTSLSGSPSAPIILATSGGIDIRASAGQEKQVASLPGGFSYVGMTGDNQGVAVPVDTSLHEIWMTFDGGLQWTAYKVSS
jgi:hypothetical protein